MNRRDAVIRLGELLQELMQEGVEIPAEMLEESLAILREEAQTQYQVAARQAPVSKRPLGSELLWVLSNGNKNAFVSYLKEVPDPELQRIAQNPTELDQTISTLQKEVELPFAPTIGGIPHGPLQSSNVYGFLYDRKDNRLFVRFNSGSVYAYEGVSPQSFAAFRRFGVPAKTSGQNAYGKWWKGKNPSMGATFYEKIRNGPYPYQRIA